MNTKKLIEFLDEEIKECKDIVSDAPECTDDWVDGIAMLTEIKGILEEQCEYFLSDGTCVCRYCGSVLGDEWEDK